MANAIYVQCRRYNGKVRVYNRFYEICLAVFSKVGMKRDNAFYFQQLSTLMHLPNFLILFPFFSEPIVEIKARINISIASWYKGTPIPMVCIAEQSDFEKEQLHVS